MSSTNSWQVEMPSNIALIKYMGKKDVEKNIPSNSSLSWTLDHLTTRVEVTMHQKGEDTWQPLPSNYPFGMSKTGYDKYITHFKRLKKHFGVEQNFLIQSSNNFPADCGIASSASSFAALTEASCRAFSELTGRAVPLDEKAMMSAQGSGSSCRSFMPGLVRWDEEGVRPVESPWAKLLHMVIIVGQGAKKVSSSEAHKRVPSSALYATRAGRSETRLSELLVDLQAQNWENIYQVVWAEFWDMHALFETSQPSFGYFQAGSVELLNITRSFWERHGQGPLVTMDAGPNIHLLWKPDQQDLASEFFNQCLKGNWTTLSNIEGVGFAQV